MPNEQAMFCCALVKGRGPKVHWLHITCHDYWTRLETTTHALVAIQNRVPLKDSPLGEHTCGECRMCFEITGQAIHTAEGTQP